MRKILPDKLEAGRVRTGLRASEPEWGTYGDFAIQGPCVAALVITASGADADDHLAEGWEHVSVSCKNRCPNWTEMSFVKDLFWEPEECVVQFHVDAERRGAAFRVCMVAVIVLADAAVPKPAPSVGTKGPRVEPPVAAMPGVSPKMFRERFEGPAPAANPIGPKEFEMADPSRRPHDAAAPPLTEAQEAAPGPELRPARTDVLQTAGATASARPQLLADTPRLRRGDRDEVCARHHMRRVEYTRRGAPAWRCER